MKLDEIKPAVRSVTRRDYSPVETPLVRAEDCRLLYILDGNGAFYVGDGRLSLFAPGSLLLLQPNVSHALRPEQGLASVIEVGFDYLCDELSEEAERPARPDAGSPLAKSHEAVCFDDTPCLNEPLVLHGLMALTPIFLSMLAIYEMKKPRWRLLLGVDFTYVLLKILDKANDQGGELVDSVIDVVRRRYMTPLTNADIAVELGYHPNYVNTVFLKRMGVTIHQYLMRYRVDKAIGLLIGTNLPIAEVADKTGFRYFSHFSQCFRRITGFSPGAYRGEKQITEERT